MAKFNVIVPAHDPHLQCYREMAIAIEWGLQQLGHEVTAGGRPIYLGLPLGAIPGDAILFNGEQVSSESLWQARALPQIYKRHTIWDYSEANAKRYGEFGLPVPPVVRPGFCPLLEGEWIQEHKTHDVVFFGSSNPRREQTLTQIAEKHSVLRVPFGVYGEERDHFLKRARLCINIHFYDSSIFESVRCSHLVANRLLVLTEESERAEELLWGVTSCEYSDLPSTVTALLGSPQEMMNRLIVQTDAWRSTSLVDDLGAALQQLDHRPGLHIEIVAPAPELTLCMIVKDEADVIERCLTSVKPHIKRWSIVDTGSNDGTQEIIRSFMSNVPGTLHESTWKNYDGSRTEALDLARRECSEQGWLLLIDADEIYSPRGPITLSEAFAAYQAWVARCDGCVPWGRPTYVRANRPWFFALPRHEGLYCREHAPSCHDPIQNSFILSTYDGARAKTGEHERYMEDARVLATWITDNPHSPYLSRAQFYLAQSYRDASTGVVPIDREASELSIEHYLKRIPMGGFEQEVFAAYHWAIDAMIKCDHPWEKIQHTLLQAFGYRPIRAEPLFRIGEHYRKQCQYALAELFLRKAASLPLPRDSFPDLDPSVYLWRAKEELAVALTYLNGHVEAKALNREALLRPELTPHERLRIEANLVMCLRVAPDSA